MGNSNPESERSIESSSDDLPPEVLAANIWNDAEAISGQADRLAEVMDARDEDARSIDTTAVTTDVLDAIEDLVGAVRELEQAGD